MMTISSLKNRLVASPMSTTVSITAALFLSVAALLTSIQSSAVVAFQPTCRMHQYISTLTPTTSRQFGRTRRRNCYGDNDMILYSSIGGGSDNRPPPPPSDNNNGGTGDLGDFLDPMRKQDSENLKRAREFMSERSLPLSFDTDDEDDDMDIAKDQTAITPTVDTTSGATYTLTSTTSKKFNNSATSSALFGTEVSNSSDLLANNPYMQVVAKISPSEVIAKFTTTADPRVQEAVRTTILGLIGSLPKLAFDTTCITTGQRLASLVREKNLRYETCIDIS
jgi:hypothetical protein